MANSVLRQPSWRLSSGALINKRTGNIGQLIANEFWNITTNLTKRVSFAIKNAAGSLVASTAVQYAIFEYKSGVPFNLDWMKPIATGVFTTDANGVFDVIYTGEAAVGGTAYVAIIHPHSSPTEALIWTTTIV